MTSLFFDLDGTIVNSQVRQYKLFREMVNDSDLTYDNYWNIKRKNIDQKSFLKKYYNYSDRECADFRKKWCDNIEDINRILRYDYLVPGIDILLRTLFKDYKVYLVTNRLNKENVNKELEYLNIKNIFSKIFVTEHNKKKADIIQANIKYGFSDIIIGDSVDDILTANILGLQSIIVCWGICDKNTIIKKYPDFIFETVDELRKFFYD